MDDNKIQLFEDKRIRTAWDDENEEWLFSIVDAVAILTDQPTQRNASTYWAVLKKRLKEEGADQLLTNCKQLKMTAEDGKSDSQMLSTPNSFCALFNPFHRPEQSRLSDG
jgi:hypothetical protein